MWGFRWRLIVLAQDFRPLAVFTFSCLFPLFWLEFPFSLLSMQGFCLFGLVVCSFFFLCPFTYEVRNIDITAMLNSWNKSRWIYFKDMKQTREIVYWFQCERANFPHSSLHGAMFWIYDQNGIGCTLMFQLLLNSGYETSRAFSFYLHQ